MWIVALSGPLKGKSFPLSEAPLTLGRESACEVVLSDVSVSRRHCTILNDTGKAVLTDLDSMNGTFVNGVPIKNRQLQTGDRIQVGASMFIFSDSESAGEAHNISYSDESPVSTVRIEPGLPASSAEKHLSVLLNLSSVLQQIEEPEELQKRILQIACNILPAQFGAVLLIDPRSDDVVSATTHEQLSGSLRPVSRTICRAVLKDGAALLSNDVGSDPKWQQAASIQESQIQSVLCAPLFAGTRIIGLIYLATATAGTHFSEDHLQLIAAVGSIAGSSLQNAIQIQALREENRALRNETAPHGMIGESAAMREVYRVVDKVAAADSTVLITGESGTGKEMAARAIHFSSARKKYPFVAINCASLSETLFESELFGHEKGAFTGAVAQKKGKLEIADRGTLFLDEVGELPAGVQAKLLRVLQERQFERLGGLRTIAVDVRVIAATNKDLQTCVSEKTFRSDLYYRLNVVQLHMPALRERKEDISLLASYFVSQFREKVKRPLLGISPEARAYLLTYDWPGNVRELQNAMERAVVLGADEWIHPEDLPEPILDQEPPENTKAALFQDSLRDLKRRLILQAMKASGGNYTEAARALGLHPNYLHRLIRNLNLKKQLTR